MNRIVLKQHYWVYLENIPQYSASDVEFKLSFNLARQLSSSLRPHKNLVSSATCLTYDKYQPSKILSLNQSKSDCPIFTILILSIECLITAKMDMILHYYWKYLLYVIWYIAQIVILRFINIKMNVISHPRSICYCYFVFDYSPRTQHLIEQQKHHFTRQWKIQMFIRRLC